MAHQTSGMADLSKWNRFPRWYAGLAQGMVLIPYCNITLWFAIALAEIRTRRLFREKADCKQSRTKKGSYWTLYQACVPYPLSTVPLPFPLPPNPLPLLKPATQTKRERQRQQNNTVKKRVGNFFGLEKGKMRWISSCYVLRNSLIF